MNNYSANPVSWCDQNGHRLTVMSPVCVYESNALLSPSQPQNVVGFASYVAVPALCVLCTLPLNKLTKGVQVYHMFSIPCLELILLLVIFQMDCSFKILHTRLLFWWGVL